MRASPRKRLTLNISADGLKQWTIQSALQDHPTIVIQTAPERPIECTVNCLSIRLDPLIVHPLSIALREVGDGTIMAEHTMTSWTCVVEGVTVDCIHITDASDDVLHIHRLDVEGFIEKLLAARATSQGD